MTKPTHEELLCEQFEKQIKDGLRRNTDDAEFVTGDSWIIEKNKLWVIVQAALSSLPRMTEEELLEMMQDEFLRVNYGEGNEKSISHLEKHALHRCARALIAKLPHIEEKP